MMEYGRLIRDAWQMTWRHPSLWILGLFAGGTAGISFNWRSEAPTHGGPVPGAHLVTEDVTRWISGHVGLIVGAAALLLVLGLIVVAVSLVAQGGLARATADMAAGRDISLGRAWRAGLRLFWRYVGLWLLLLAAVAVAAGAIAAFVAAAIGLLSGGGEQAVWVVVPLVLVGLVMLLAGFVAAVVAGIVVTYAQRAIAVRDVGPVAALRDGWELFHAHPGSSVLLWLLYLALTIGASLVVVAAMIATLVVLGLPGFALWAMFQLSAPTIAYAVVAALTALCVLLAIGAIANTFFWSFWTLAYLRLGPARPVGTVA